MFVLGSLCSAASLDQQCGGHRSYSQRFRERPKEINPLARILWGPTVQVIVYKESFARPNMAVPSLILMSILNMTLLSLRLKVVHTRTAREPSLQV